MKCLSDYCFGHHLFVHSSITSNRNWYFDQRCCPELPWLPATPPSPPPPPWFFCQAPPPYSPLPLPLVPLPPVACKERAMRSSWTMSRVVTSKNHDLAAPRVAPSSPELAHNADLSKYRFQSPPVPIRTLNENYILHFSQSIHYPLATFEHTWCQAEAKLVPS